ncbi:MAG: DUF262 domain-containing protein [Kiritimatiellae bacterium]|nr:DUF262 domain-containing protein [Kiritimatiellia bacterium]
MVDYKEDLTKSSVVQAPVLQDEVSLFDLFPCCTFKVPLYQRAFAWGTPPHEVNENELICLMDDIHDAAISDENGTNEYYIGSVVVKATEKDSHLWCEVIDGQQRLTALFILLNCLGVEIKSKNPLDYAQRVRSRRTVMHIKEIIKFAKAFVCKADTQENCVQRATKQLAELDAQVKEGDWLIKEKANEKGVALENSMCNGVVSILRHLRARGDEYKNRMLKGLSKVRLYLVRVPDTTDLNRYFEVMNTRGEQLDPEDIVKAMLMRQLTDVNKRKRFAQIWNACSDMNGYVQMHFSSGVRDEIFGKDWSAMPQIDVGANGEGVCDVKCSICESLLMGKVKDESNEEQVLDDGSDELEGRGDPVRFRSVIYFPHFLLNVLKVFNHKNNQGDLDRSELDVSKMIRRFEDLFKKDGGDNEKNGNIAWDFAKCLLTCRCLFDKYIVKRDYERDAVDGDWSLKQLRQSVDESGKKRTAYYVASDWCDGEENVKSNSREEILMLQSCLRVTYTEFKGMHWVTRLLDWLYRVHVDGVVSFVDLVNEAERYACVETKGYVAELTKENLREGTSTPHIIFNYLDFLLWRDAKEKKKFKSQGAEGTWEPFVFAYRNSVEHWYPQHPEGCQQNQQLVWIDPDGQGRRAVDQFGNLCVVQPSENSKFSNLKPSAKKIQYRETVFGGSLKLRLMAELTPANEVGWKEVCAIHGNDMLGLLDSAFRRVLGVNPNNDPA